MFINMKYYIKKLAKKKWKFKWGVLNFYLVLPSLITWAMHCKHFTIGLDVLVSPTLFGECARDKHFHAERLSYIGIGCLIGVEFSSHFLHFHSFQRPNNSFPHYNVEVPHEWPNFHGTYSKSSIHKIWFCYPCKMPHQYIDGPAQTLTFRFEVGACRAFFIDICNVLCHVFSFLIDELLEDIFKVEC